MSKNEGEWQGGLCGGDKLLEESVGIMRNVPAFRALKVMFDAGRLQRMKIIPKKAYTFDSFRGQVFFTGAQLLETKAAFLALCDAKESGDENKIKEAMELISKLPKDNEK